MCNICISIVKKQLTKNKTLYFKDTIPIIFGIIQSIIGIFPANYFFIINGITRKITFNDNLIVKRMTLLFMINTSIRLLNLRQGDTGKELKYLKMIKYEL